MVLIASAALAGAPARSGQSTADSVPNVLIELFTSEGCSSCPPADELLIELLRTQPVRGVHVIGLSEHVDYWDKLGWVDPFSSALFTNRQVEYGWADVYTPEIVVDGKTPVVGSARSDVITAIRRAALAPKAAVQLSWVPGPDRSLQIVIPAAAQLANGIVMLAITEDALSNKVKRGENQGREMRHDAVTRKLTRIGSTDAGGGFSQRVSVGPMIDSGWKKDALHVVVFVQNAKGWVLGVGQLTTSN